MACLAELASLAEWPVEPKWPALQSGQLVGLSGRRVASPQSKAMQSGLSAARLQGKGVQSERTLETSL